MFRCWVGGVRVRVRVGVRGGFGVVDGVGVGGVVFVRRWGGGCCSCLWDKKRGNIDG